MENKLALRDIITFSEGQDFLQESIHAQLSPIQAFGDILNSEFLLSLNKFKFSATIKSINKIKLCVIIQQQ